MRPTILLLPGLDGTEVLYRPLVRSLAPAAEVHVVEYAPDGPCDYEAALARASERLARLPACHVVGWSFSGPVALRLARAYPDRVRSVTLVATFVQHPLPHLRWAGPLLSAPLVWCARAIRRLPIWLGRSRGDPLRRDKAEIWRRIGARTLAARARAIRRLDAREDLAAVTQPMQYMVFSRDRVVPSQNLEQLRAIRGDLEVVPVDGDHFALYACPDVAAAAVLAFASREQERAALERPDVGV